MKSLYLFLSILIVCLASSCATNRFQKYRDFFDDSPGLTYDQAIATFGNPTSVTLGTEVYVVVWDRQQTYKSTRYKKERTGTQVSRGNGPTIITPIYEEVPETDEGVIGEKITITFDKSNNTIVHWNVCSYC